MIGESWIRIQSSFGHYLGLSESGELKFFSWFDVFSSYIQDYYTLGIPQLTSLALLETGSASEATLWKWTEDGKLMNKEKEFSWKYGDKKWTRVNNFIVDDETGKVLEIKDSNQTVEAEVLLDSKNKQATANQRWHFESLDRTFVIASLDHHDKVLGAKMGDYLSASYNEFAPNQIWRMSTRGYLQTKEGIVAAISGGNRSPGASVIVWQKNDSNHQKWTFEDEHLISNLNGLAMERDSNLDIKMDNKGGECQKWAFVPEDLWATFQLMQETKNPLTEALFYKEVYDNYFWAVSGFTSIYDFKRNFEDSIKTLREAADHLDKVAVDTGIAGAVGGGSAIAGSVLSIAGLILAPFTAGASLGLTAAGAALGVAGGVTSITGSVINQNWEKEDAKKYQKEFTSMRLGILRLQGFLKTYIDKLNKSTEFLKTEEGEQFALDALKISTAWDAGEIVKTSIQTVWTTYRVVQSIKLVKNNIEIIKAFKAVKGLVDIVQEAYNAGLAVKISKDATKVGLALYYTRPGWNIPLVAKRLVTAGTKTAQAISGIFAVVGVAFGIWEVVESADKIKEGSDLADEFREKANELEKEMKRLVDLDQELQS